MTDYFVRYVTYLDPNGNNGPDVAVVWPEYDTDAPQLLTLLDGDTPLVISNDTYREDPIKYVIQLELARVNGQA